MKTNAEINIVIVDSSNTTRSTLRTILKSEDYNISGEFKHGQDLIADLSELQPDILCLNHDLPGISGLDLLKDIHQIYPDIAIVFIADSSLPNLEEEATKSGAAGFIRKPFTPSDVINNIDQITLTYQIISDNFLQEQPPQESQARIVVADDSLSMRKLLVAILEQCGVKVVAEACDGKQAIEMVAKHHPDIIFLDIEMPVMDGLQALTVIHSQHPKVKALMITSRAERECVIKAAKMGAKGYIIKPYKPSLIIQEIEKLLPHAYKKHNIA